jgi:hypothetical protein
VGTGQYRVVLSGSAFGAGNGYVQLTAFGAGAAAHCHASGVSASGAGLDVTVSCFAVRAMAPAQPVDTAWLLSYVDGSGLSHDAQIPAAYATIAGDPANPTVDTRHSYASDGEQPAVARLATGHYRLTYLRLGKYGDTVQVMATGNTGSYCHLGDVTSAASAPRVTIDVYCHTSVGLLSDAPFAIAYLRVP